MNSPGGLPWQSMRFVWPVYLIKEKPSKNMNGFMNRLNSCVYLLITNGAVLTPDFV